MSRSWLASFVCVLGLVQPIACAGASSRVGEPQATPRSTRADAAEPPSYSRKSWRHWIDADHDCQDTRQEVLIAESEVPVEFADTRHCKVKRGRWTCPYTGRVVSDPAELDIDHMVPLENANAAGGWRWSAVQKREFANDLAHPEQLVAVVASANRAKGSRGPDEWLPPNVAFRCRYVVAWEVIKKRWHLSITGDEEVAVSRVLSTCRTP